MISQCIEAICLEIRDEVDIAYAAMGAKKYAASIGFTTSGQYMISTAVSELARNIFVYAKKGTINLNPLERNAIKGIEIIAEDSGPGIDDIQKALEDEFSTGGTMGVGLPGTKRLMDEFIIDSYIGIGTKITVRKWI